MQKIHVFDDDAPKERHQTDLEWGGVADPF